MICEEIKCCCSLGHLYQGLTILYSVIKKEALKRKILYLHSLFFFFLILDIIYCHVSKLQPLPNAFSNSQTPLQLKAGTTLTAMFHIPKDESLAEA